MPRRKRVPGNLERRGDSYRVRLCVDGRRYKFTVDTNDRRVAAEFAVKRFGELQAEAARKTAGQVVGRNMTELLDAFERDELPTLAPGTQRTYRDSLKPTRTYFVDEIRDPDTDEEIPNPPVRTIRAAHVKAFLAWRRVRRRGAATTSADTTAPKKAVSNRTLGKDLSVLSRLLSYADTLEWRDGNPAARVTAPEHEGRQPVILTDDEYDKLLDACVGRPMLKLYLLTVGEPGVRNESEVLWLQWPDVELDSGFVRVVTGRDGHRTKTGRSRWVPMSPRLQSAMRAHFAQYRFAAYDGTASPWVFHHDRSQRMYTAGQRVKSFHTAFRNTVKRAKLPPNLWVYDLRHRRITNWLGEGQSPVHVRDAAGHADLRTTMRYTHLTREHLRPLAGATVPKTPQEVAK